MKMPIDRRIRASIIKTGTCWLWKLAPTSEGYGQIKVDGKMLLAHRLVYERMVGPIPDGLTLDHLCRVRHCVNPRHLEPVTIGVNTLRGVGPAAVNARKTHCNQGHALAPENLQSGPSGRICLACHRAKQARYLARKRGQVA